MNSSDTRWDEAAAVEQAKAEHEARVANWKPHEPITVAQLRTALEQLVEWNYEVADWPVHILDMEDDDKDEHPWDGLVTHVETDCMAEEQGPVVALFAWRNQGPRPYQPPFCPECRIAVPYHRQECSYRPASESLIGKKDRKK